MKSQLLDTSYAVDNTLGRDIWTKYPQSHMLGSKKPATWQSLLEDEILCSEHIDTLNPRQFDTGFFINEDENRIVLFNEIDLIEIIKIKIT